MSELSTEQIPFPVLLVGKFGILHFRGCPAELVTESGRLRRLYDEKGYYFVDNNLKRYQIVGTTIIQGHGRFGGWSFDGPFLLKREVLFSAELKFIKQLDLKMTAELIANFIKKAEDAGQNDVARFWEAFNQCKRRSKSVAGSRA